MPLTAEHQALAWLAAAARTRLIAGGAWLTVVLSLAFATAPDTLGLGVAWFVAAGLVGVTPLVVSLLRLRVPVVVLATPGGLEVRSGRRRAPIEGLLPWGEVELRWSSREDGENLAVHRKGGPTLLLSAANDDQLVQLRHDIERLGVRIRRQ